MVLGSPVLGDGSDILGSMAALSTDDVWAVGSHEPPGGGPAQPMAMHWDGGTWQLAPVPSPGAGGSRLLSVAGTASDDVWAVGTTTGATQKALILHWNGAAWRVA